jgi:prepilin-type N-terminal cleavage/methylation domain-containing protein
MKNEQGFSLIELLIVVAIIAIIAAIAVPSLLTSRMAANESGGIQGCRSVGSAEVAYASTNNQMYASIANLVTGQFLDTRFINGAGFNGYTYTDNVPVVGVPAGVPTTVPTGFGILATPTPGAARYGYGIGPDQVVRIQTFITPATALPGGGTAGDGIGTTK